MKRLNHFAWCVAILGTQALVGSVSVVRKNGSVPAAGELSSPTPSNVPSAPPLVCLLHTATLVVYLPGSLSALYHV